jgi:hypothetical protein
MHAATISKNNFNISNVSTGCCVLLCVARLIAGKRVWLICVEWGRKQPDIHPPDIPWLSVSRSIFPHKSKQFDQTIYATFKRTLLLVVPIKIVWTALCTVTTNPDSWNRNKHKAFLFESLLLHSWLQRFRWKDLEIQTARVMNLKSVILCDITPCSPLKSNDVSEEHIAYIYRVEI